MTREELDAWVDEEPEEPEDVTFHVVIERPRKLRGVWRNKKMKADRSPMYLTDYRNEKHIWLTPITLKHAKKITLHEVK